jgi:tetratricopeptide (TPR) repeat protein
VHKAEEASGDARKLFKLLKKLTFKVADQLDAAVTADERTRIESTDRISFDALAVYSEGLELLDAGKNSEARAKFAEAVKIEPDFGRAKTQLQLLEEKSK